MKFKGDVIITDPCYIMKDAENGFPECGDDWGNSDYGSNMEALGIKTYLTRDTIYGDWSCTTFNTDTKEAIGKFCADAGLVSVMLLSEVLAYNPNFNYHKEKPWTTTLIKDFDGDIDIKVLDRNPEDCDCEDKEDCCCDEQYVSVVGTGNINFRTSQTGF
jgi:hypothetical protein